MFILVTTKFSTQIFYFNVEAKSITIRRMQSNLEVWEEKLRELYEKKKENGKINNNNV